MIDNDLLFKKSYCTQKASDSHKILTDKRNSNLVGAGFSRT